MTDLELRLAALEDRVTELKRELARRHGSMAQTRRCPACGHGALFHFTRVREHQRGPSPTDLALHHVKHWIGGDGLAPLEAYACRQCLLVEWHARDLDKVEADGDQIVALDAEPEPPPPADGPFR